MFLLTNTHFSGLSHSLFRLGHGSYQPLSHGTVQHWSQHCGLHKNKSLRDYHRLNLSFTPHRSVLRVRNVSIPMLFDLLLLSEVTMIGPGCGENRQLSQGMPDRRWDVSERTDLTSSPPPTLLDSVTPCWQRCAESFFDGRRKNKT